MAITKSLKSQVDHGKCVDLPVCGRFSRISDTTRVCFIPHLDFIASASFSFPENESNVSPFAKSAVGLSSNLVTVSLSSVAAACKMDRESCGSIIKEIFVNFIKHARRNRFVKLDMKVGSLVCYPNGSLQFENYNDAENTEESRFEKRRLQETERCNSVAEVYTHTPDHHSSLASRSSTTEFYRDRTHEKTKQHLIDNLSVKTPFSYIDA